MIVQCVGYQNGVSLGSIPLDQLPAALEQPGVWVWLGLFEPDAALLKDIKRIFDLHELAVEDAASAHQRPKIEEYGDSLFLVLHTAILSGKQVMFGETHIFCGQRFIVTVRHGASHGLGRARARCEGMPAQLAKGPGFALYSIMDLIVDEYMPVLEGLQQRFDVLELAIFQQRPSRLTLEGLYELKRELLRLHAAIMPLVDICNELMRFHHGFIHKDVRVYFRDIADHIKRIDQGIDATREMLIAAMQVHLTFETVRQNEVVKGLAGWGAILAIPTMVFSWYGMNFKDMPELNWPYSYPVVMGLVIVGSLLLYRRLKRLGWI